MKFSFDESELINNFLSNMETIPSKEFFTDKLNCAKINTADPELILIADNTIRKLQMLNDDSFKGLVSNLPVDTYTIY